MPNTSKSSKPIAPAAAGNPELADAFTPFLINSVERAAELQKKSLEIAAEQTADWMGAWKQAFSFFPAVPAAFVLDVAGQAIQTALETQKSTIDLIVEQTKSVAAIARMRTDAYARIADGVTGEIRKSVERSVEAQKKVLEFASEQNEMIFENTRKHLGTANGPATAMVDTFRRGTESVIEAQKSILDAASQQFAAAANA